MAVGVARKCCSHAAAAPWLLSMFRKNEAQVGRERLRNHETKEFKGRRGARAAQKLMGPVWNRRPARREGGPEADGPRVESAPGAARGRPWASCGRLAADFRVED